MEKKLNQYKVGIELNNIIIKKVNELKVIIKIIK